MEIPSIVIRVPEYSQAFVFGSVLFSNEPNDFDMLIIYDETVCQPIDAYDKHKELCSSIRVLFNLPVHLTLLTHAEEQCVCFIEQTNAVPLDQALRSLRLTTRWHKNLVQDQ